ncbi:hypothetical protein P5F55_13940 [Clostridium perfringens]|uniref:hypothetical protein n=1 Tax=Clostridium perfringens TaxID=1502 RepID=UPI002970E6D6|nr:hypothetical protein [Clostridium perfringens]MDK0834992.1 hypothetical protein [Clostridium perfringens]MDK0928463.1 hypothetical protein [Clostridium perfringens]MDM0495312.1 hypothetical protein [Clostridium perfringens]MDM0781028.1 hypothetical protein [Clostridium perfringens]
MKGKKWGILFIVFLFVLFILTGCGTIKESQQVSCKIISKEYTAPSSYTTMMSTGKALFPVTHTIPAKYELTVEYGEYRKVVDSEQLFQSLEIGDSMNMILIKEYSKDTGSLEKTYLKEAY